MCDRTNSEEIVLEMLGYLETADYSIREEMVGKTFFGGWGWGEAYYLIDLLGLSSPRNPTNHTINPFYSI